MNAINEKSSSVMGIVISVLLHGIFFAGCFALDAAASSGKVVKDQPTTEMHSAAAHTSAQKAKS